MANRFSQLRKRLRPVPTYTEFAEQVKPCSDQQIRRLEAGFSNPGLQLAYRVAKALGKSVYDVFPPEAA